MTNFRAGRLRQSACIALVLALLPCAAPAQQWKPSRPVEIGAPSAAGGGSDVVARLVQRIIDTRGLVPVPTVVVNRAGAGGAIAWTSLTGHAGDAHYLAVSTANLLTNHITGRSTLNYSDLTPVAQLFSESVGIAVRADSPLRSARELLDLLRADASRVSAAVGTSLGNSGHVTLALAAKAAGGDARKLRAVVFGGASQGVTALLGGHVDLIASPASNLMALLAEKKVRILALSAPARLTGALAGIPTWRESGADVVIDNLRGVIAPAGLTPAQVAYWEGVFSALVQSEEWRRSLEQNSWSPGYAGSEGSRAALRLQYDQLRTGLSELGLAK
jgi:putative tricarboxylic transport membrane protein